MSAVEGIADGFDFPCGAPSGANYYIAAGLVDPDYFKRFNAWHTGEDWNGYGYGDTDLGDPVYAIANGVVTASDFFSSWGNIVLIEHVMPDGNKAWSQYAHLRERMVGRGNKVTRGQQVGTIGKGANDRWIAHLHFEIRRRELLPTAWGWTREQVLNQYYHPSDFIKSHRPGSMPVISGVEITLDEVDKGFVKSSSEYWYEAPVGYRGRSYWTHTLAGEEDCWAEWRPEITQTGLYEVMAFIPSQNATTKQARYKVTHRRGTDTVSVDQSRYFDQWVSLGRYPLSIHPSMPTVVRLSDMTGEPLANRVQIGFDAMRFILLQKE
ncbi:MAG: peptidoglycan DD-metalloendopeptidase family protein [Anaerolineae bacterium]|nr:peptidoglycan DD-metalloendopeptidase family protein [Anaerolineae bacterium]